MNSPISIATGALVVASCAVLSFFYSPEEINSLFQKEDDSISRNTEIVNTIEPQEVLQHESQKSSLLSTDDGLWNSMKTVLNANNTQDFDEVWYGKILAGILLASVLLNVFLLLRKPKQQTTSTYLPQTMSTQTSSIMKKEEPLEVLPKASTVAKEQPSLDVQLGPQEQHVKSKNIPSHSISSPPVENQEETETPNEVQMQNEEPQVEVPSEQLLTEQPTQLENKPSFDETLNEVQMQNEELKKLLEERDITINEFRAKEEEFNAYVQKVETEKQEAQQTYETTIEELKTEAMDKINSQEATINQMRSELEEKDSRLGLYENAITERDAEIQSLKEDLDKLKEVLMQLESGNAASSIGTGEAPQEYGEEDLKVTAQGSSSSITIEPSAENETGPTDSESQPIEESTEFKEVTNEEPNVENEEMEGSLPNENAEEPSAEYSGMDRESVPNNEEATDSAVSDTTESTNLYASTIITSDENNNEDSTVNESTNTNDSTLLEYSATTEEENSNNNTTFDLPAKSELRTSKSQDDLQLASTSSSSSIVDLESTFGKPKKRNSLPASYFKLAKQWYQNQERTESFNMQI